MEILSSSLLSKPHFLSPVSPLSSLSSFTTFTKKTPLKIHKTRLNSFSNSPFPTVSPHKNRINTQIFARIVRPTKRRNSLRKKLDSKVRKNPHKLIDPVPHFIDDVKLNSVLGIDSLENVSGELGETETFNVDNSRKFGESVMWDKLDGWVEQYKKDIEFWGIGSNPIFTVFQDSRGSVEKVFIDEDEILRRNGVEPLYYKENRKLDVFNEVNLKILHARNLAREIEGGNNVISKNSSVTKFVFSGEKLGFVSSIKRMFVHQKSLTKVSRVGIAIICGFVFVLMIKKIFTLREKEPELTGLEKEMLKRKMKSRMVKQNLEKGSVEVVEELSDSLSVFTERPRLDKEEVLNSIREAKGLDKSLVVLDVGRAQETAFGEMSAKIREIQKMARDARKIEKEEGVSSEENESDEQYTFDKLESMEEDIVEGFEGSIWIGESGKQASSVPFPLGKDIEGLDVVDMNFSKDFLNGTRTEIKHVNGISDSEILGELEMENSDSNFIGEQDEYNEDLEIHSDSNGTIINDDETPLSSLVQSFDISNSSNSTEGIDSYISSSQLNPPKTIPVRRKSKIIRSVKEAREYLLQKNSERDQVGDITTSADAKDERMDLSPRLGKDDEIPESFDLVRKVPAPKVSKYYNVKGNECLATDTNVLKVETENEMNLMRPYDSPSAENSGDAQNMGTFMKVDEMFERIDSHERSDPITGENDFSDVSHEANGPHVTEKSVGKANELGEMLKEKMHLSDVKDDVELGRTTEKPEPTKLSEILAPGAGSDTEENAYRPTETLQNAENVMITEKENWLEKNFHEVEPIVKKIGSGFRNSYNVAREKIKAEEDTKLDFMKIKQEIDEMELEWMQDSKLREIVFKVRDNELAGKDPFHSMDNEDKLAFFKGLETKVEKENQKLSMLHEWLHSNIENIDYGTDGISLYDPPEKVVPRWKGPPLDTIPEFLNNSRDQQPAASSVQKVNESTKHDNDVTSLKANTSKSMRKEKGAKSSKTVIEASDGSIKPGKRSGKEYWQHTKKWSRGFVESFNAETDPEVKSVMKDIGKDLDRWITEKEIQDAANLMDKIPQKRKEILEKKLSKLKREMELFGPQAVVSKYREYAEQKEEDYLWWLDLPHLLCLELYTYEGEDQRVGFYSLEMAADLELEPKPNHVIAFQDPGDCKNFCYILQGHLEMLGKGKAFIVPQPPKDVFRQAKGNGFGVTVIRKGELKLNIDQPLEEVEELITEIGSKMYHDKMMRERSVDIDSLIKGVFGVSPPSKRKRKKRARKRPSKP
ncbi:uncharacterized protein LOC130809625 [Amaranthus tricolor]|uniref:uncharacterized protein LOC130809625 n=1 Tax=Amaranthus tricolor TaxID=29722 RepID=UPI002588816B|nr:uncharacterized protein LOC130809625 [Amaranthus tricolor]